MAQHLMGSVRRQLMVLVGVAVVAFGLLLYFSRDTLSDTWDSLINANLGFVLLLPILQVINYFFIGQYYRKMFANFHTLFTKARAWGVVAAMNFVNQVLPSGGLSGITYLAYGFRSSLETGKTTLIQLGRYVFAFGSYLIIGPVAVFLLIQTGNLNEFNELVNNNSRNLGALLTLIGFVIFSGFVLALFLNRKFAHRVGMIFVASVAWFKKKILRSKKPLRLKLLRRIYHEFNDGVDFIRHEGIGILKPSFYMLFSAITELAIVYSSLLAVGEAPPIGVVFISFVAANIVGVVSIIPGDVGVHEATVIIVLSAFGVPEASAISATLLYRVFNKFIFLPIGFYFYAKILKPAVEAKPNG